MKVYSKKKEDEAWHQYEHYIVEYHRRKYNHIVWHWSVTPEEHLWNAGYINEYNKHRLERLASSKEGINRHKDYGLDGFVLDTNNNYHGLQSKFYSTNKVSANDIGTFQRVVLRMNKKNSLSKGYLYTSTNLEPTLAEDIQCIGDIIHEKVLFELEDKRTTRHQKKVVEEVNLPLRQYQKDALESLKEEREGLGTLSLFCGGGKTLIAGHYLSELKPKIIVMMAPLKISVDNLRQRMESFFESHEHLVIDSDSGNTTDADLVKEKLDLDKPIVLYTTFASAVNVLSELFEDYEELFEDSFCLVDECHNIVNNTELCEFISRFYDGLLMSATIPEELYEVIECEPVYNYGMAEAIKDGYCVDYNVLLPQVVKKDEGNTIEIDIPEDFEKSDLCAKVLYLVTGMLQTGSKRCIVYLRNTDECVAFNELFTKVCKEYHGLKSWTETIDCNVKQEKRRSILEDFQSEKEDLTTLHILASVRILDEAVDVVRCDSEFITYVGVNADDKRAVQRLQRGGRLDSMNPSKKNNLFIWCSEYASMLSMLSLLKESDPEFHTKLRILNGSYDAVGKKESVEKSAVQLGDLQKYLEVKCLSLIDYHKQNINKVKEFYEKYGEPPKKYGKRENEYKYACYLITNRQNKKNNILSLEIQSIIEEEWPWFSWDPINSIRDEKLEQCRQFYKEYNEPPKRNGTRLNEKTLCYFLDGIKKNNKKSKISDDYKKIIIDKLPWFCWDQFAESRNKSINNLVEFYNEYNEAPKLNGIRKNEKQLYNFIADLRKSNNEGNINNTFKDEFNTKFNWFIWNPLIDKQDKIIKGIKEYYEKNNKCPQSNDKIFGSWISNIRTSKKNNKLNIDLENKIKKELPWFKFTLESPFNNHIKELQQFYKENKRLPFETPSRVNEYKLACWIRQQRQRIKNNKMSKEYKDKLTIECPWLEV